MGIYTRPDSPWFWLHLERPGQKPIRERTGIPVNGSTPEQTKDLRRLAEAAYNVRMAELARTRYRLPATTRARTVGALLDWYLAHVSVHKRSKASDHRIAGLLRARFGALPVPDVTREGIREWMTDRRRQVSAATVNREFALLRHALRQAVPDEIEINPCTGIARLREARREIAILSREEEVRLLAVLNPWETAIILTALDTLMRLTNVRLLKREHDQGAWLTVVDSKVDRYEVPVSTRLRAALDALPERGPYYFGTRADQPPSKGRITRMFRDACQRAHIRTGRAVGGLTFHCLRHTGASRLVEAGVDLRTVQELGGWKTLTQLARYAHASDARRLQAVNLIAGKHALDTDHAETAENPEPNT